MTRWMAISVLALCVSSCGEEDPDDTPPVTPTTPSTSPSTGGMPSMPTNTMPMPANTMPMPANTMPMPANTMPASGGMGGDNAGGTGGDNAGGMGGDNAGGMGGDNAGGMGGANAGGDNAGGTGGLSSGGIGGSEAGGSDSDSAGGSDTGGDVVYFTDVHSIFTEKCGPCHVSNNSGGHNIGGSELGLAYQDAITRRDGIVQMIEGGLMPANAGCGDDPTQDACVTAEQLELIKQWVEDGGLEAP